MKNRLPEALYAIVMVLVIWTVFCTVTHQDIHPNGGLKVHITPLIK